MLNQIKDAILTNSSVTVNNESGTSIEFIGDGAFLRISIVSDELEASIEAENYGSKIIEAGSVDAQIVQIREMVGEFLDSNYEEFSESIAETYGL